MSDSIYGDGWREGVIGGGIFWRDVVKYSK